MRSSLTKTEKQSGPRRWIKTSTNFHVDGKTPCKQTNVLRCVGGPSRKDYEEVGIETAEGEGEEEGYGDEFWVLLRGLWHPNGMCNAQERPACGRVKLSGTACVQTSDAKKHAVENVRCWGLIASNVLSKFSFLTVTMITMYILSVNIFHKKHNQSFFSTVICSTSSLFLSQHSGDCCACLLLLLLHAFLPWCFFQRCSKGVEQIHTALRLVYSLTLAFSWETTLSPLFEVGGENPCHLFP